jgi:hypothetical protein
MAKRTVVDQLLADKGVGWSALVHRREDPYRVRRLWLRKGAHLWRCDDSVPPWRVPSALALELHYAYTPRRGLQVWQARCDHPHLWRGLVPEHPLDLGVRDALRAVQSLET